MSKGAILFAFNSPKFNYYDMAVATAKRINHFLNIPVTLFTDEESIPTTQSNKDIFGGYKRCKIIIITIKGCTVQ